MATEILRNVPTNELQLGDVVHCNGMLVELNRPAHKWSNQGRDCWSWHGTVLNAEEAVTECGIPRSFLRSHVWENGNWSTFERYPVWNVQGNEMARWTVEREV